MIVGIHQPSFFHYDGVLSRIASCDLFIILAHAQYARGNYHNRFFHEGRWFTLSVNQRLEPLIAKQYAKPVEDWLTIKRRMPAYVDVLESFDECISKSLVDTNVAILRKVCAELDIATEIVLDYPTQLTKTERLVDLCRHYGATEYFSGPSGSKYIEEELFHAANIGVKYQLSSKTPRAAIELLKERA